MNPILKEHNKINDLIVIQPEIFYDHRWENFETYNKDIYNLLFKNNIEFKIDSFSYSRKNVLRGFHGDLENCKLIQVLKGHVYFVVIDTRQTSTTYKTIQYFHLNDKNKLQIFVPAGCVNAHLVVSEECLFHYKLTNSYVNIKNQIHVKWNDPEYNVYWPIKTPILSQRDSN